MTRRAWIWGDHRWLVMGLVLILTACGGPRVRTGPAAGVDTTGEPVSVAAVPATPRRTVLREDIPKPEDIAGAAPATVRALLGAPGLTRREPPAEVWQYAGGDCVIDVVFYPPGDTGALRATHLSSRDMAGRSVPVADCLDRLAAADDE